MMQQFKGIEGVGSTLSAIRAQGKRVAFVPTMGNLHEGHLSLVRKATDVADFSVVSIFVNPLQFGEGEDYLTYPRTLEEDLAKLGRMGVDLLFIPHVDELYPLGLERITRIEVPELGAVLCGEYRPVFFRGVTTIVGMLLNIVQPDIALFGEKDYQQLVIIKRMVRDLHMPVEILAAPTVREPDGLAMSSRNRYLNEEDKARAPALFKALTEARQSILNGGRDYGVLERRGASALKAQGFRPEYFSVRRAVDLALPEKDDRELRILAAAWLGAARLIDNLAV